MNADRDDGAADIKPAYMQYTPRQRWGFLAILFFVSMWNYIDRTVISVLIEPIKAEFGASDAQMGLLTGFAFAASYAVFGIPIARLADRGNRPLIITVSLVVWSAMTACCGLAKSFPMLALARFGVGIGEAGAIPPAQSLIADYFPPSQRSRALAIFMSSAMIGTFSALTVGGMLASTYGWRTAFICVSAPGFVVVVLTALWLPEPRARDRRVGARNAESFANSLRILSHKRSYVLINVAMVLYFGVAFGVASWFPAYLVRVLGVKLSEIGTTYGALTAAAAFFGTVGGGILTDKLAARDQRWAGRGPAIILMLCCPVYEIGLLSGDLHLFYGAAAFGAAALYSAVPGIFTLLHSVCGSPRRATAVALAFFFANLLGLGVGPLITGTLSDLFSAAYGTAGLRFALMAASLMLIPSAVALWMAGGLVERDQEE